MLSMTGHGTGTAPWETGRILVDLRAVNHRFLDIRVRTPMEDGELSHRLESVLRKNLERGRVELVMRVEGTALRAAKLDVAKAREAFEDLRRLRDELSPNEALPLSLLASVPNIFETRDANTANEDFYAAAQNAAELACTSLFAMRTSEAAHLAKDLETRLESVANLVKEIAARAPEIATAHHAKIIERVSAMLRELNVELDAARVAHEVAFHVDRSDITEELTRLSSHLSQFHDLIRKSSNAPVGKKLDFLVQEIGRETNTIGSKSSDLTVTRTVVEIKTEMERIREQIQNIL